MTWMIRLLGDAWSLEDLEEWFRSFDYQVKSEGDQFFLESLELTACQTEKEAWELGERIVDTFNSAARAIQPEFRPVHAGAVIRLHEDGTRRSSVRARASLSAVARMKASVTVVKADGSVEPSKPSLVERLVKLLVDQEDDNLARALEQWRVEQDPSSLYKIAEIIRDDTSAKKPGKGNWNQMASRLAPLFKMSASDLSAEITRFRKSVHDPGVMGLLARHSYTDMPHPKPMNLEEAKSFVHRLLVAWLKSKL